MFKIDDIVQSVFYPHHVYKIIDMDAINEFVCVEPMNIDNYKSGWYPIAYFVLHLTPKQSKKHPLTNIFT